MNSYRIVKVYSFPEIRGNEVLRNVFNLSLPGFTEDSATSFRCINPDYYGYEYFEIEHEILIKDNGLAYGFIDKVPIKLEFTDYKKGFTIKAYLKRNDNYCFLSQTAFVLKDLLKRIKENQDLRTKLEEYQLNLDKLKTITQDYTGVWFKGVSSRVSSSALFGSDLINEPLFKQLSEDGANLSSVIVPYHGIQVQISQNAGISSHMKFDKIEDELAFVSKVKEEIIEKLKA